MTALVASATPADARLSSTLVATAAALAFLLLIAWPAFEYAYEESYHHHAGAGDRQHLARRGAAGRHRA